MLQDLARGTARSGGGHMPHKGKAFDKPTVNECHKREVRLQVQRAAERDATQRSELAVELCSIVENSELDSKRKQHACKVIKHACDRLENGDNPLVGLRPPPSCTACAGNAHGTHHFLCMARKLEPGAIEKKVRKTVLAKLGTAWRTHQYAVQSVSMQSARASLACV